MNPQPKHKIIKLSRRAFQKLAKQAYKRDNYQCQWSGCTKQYRGLSPHHKIFVSQGGDDVLDNIVTLCVDCHTKLHSGLIPRDLKEIQEGVCENGLTT